MVDSRQLCLVNLVALHPKVSGGVERIAYEIAHILLDHAAANLELQLVFVVNPLLHLQFVKWLGSTNAPYIVCPHRVEEGVDYILSAIRPDIIVSPVYGMEPFFKIPQLNDDIPHIAFMPDTQALEHPELFSDQQLTGRTRLYEQLRAAHMIVTISQYSAHNIVKYLKLDPAQVTYGYLGGNLLNDDTPATTDMFVPDGPFVLYPANTWQHKRHELLFEIMQQVWQENPTFQVVLTGGRGTDGGKDAKIVELIQRYAMEDVRVHDLGYVTPSHLKVLYERAKALLFVSMYEGFGMPLIEAMHYHCPVICASRTAIPEVVGTAALLVVDDENPASWAEVLLHQLPAQRDQLIQRGCERAQLFTWAKARSRYTDILREGGVQLEKNVGIQRQSRPYTLLPTADLPVLTPAADPLVPTPDCASPMQTEHLRRLFDSYEAIRLAEHQSPLSRWPLVGYFVRTLIRIRNLGNLEATRMYLYRELIEQLSTNNPDE